jgi:hypothetical protein
MKPPKNILEIKIIGRGIFIFLGDIYNKLNHWDTCPHPVFGIIFNSHKVAEIQYMLIVEYIRNTRANSDILKPVPFGPPAINKTCHKSRNHLFVKRIV